MIIRDKEYGEFDVYLGDDGTVDTVISVEPDSNIGSVMEIRFSTEYASEYRDEDGAMTDKGFAVLAKEAVEAYIEQYLLN